MWLSSGSVVIPAAHATVVTGSRAGYHLTTDQLSERAALSDCSPFGLLSASLSRDLARVITRAEAFNCCPHHFMSEGVRKAVMMPQWQENEKKRMETFAETDANLSQSVKLFRGGFKCARPDLFVAARDCCLSFPHINLSMSCPTQKKRLASGRLSWGICCRRQLMVITDTPVLWPHRPAAR